MNIDSESGILAFNSKKNLLICQDNWCLANIENLQQALSSISWPSTGKINIDASGIIHLDSAGAWLLISLQKKLQQNNLTSCIINLSPQAEKLLFLVERNYESPHPTTNQDYVSCWEFIKTNCCKAINIRTLAQKLIPSIKDYLAFLGKLVFDTGQIITGHQQLRIRSIMQQIYQAGVQSLAIIALLSFMIGIVMAYQMGFQLRNYGANVFIADLLGLSILREFSPLLTAIMVAGRTGSSFTAEIGMMKLNQEIDALNTMGISSPSFLFLPKIVALLLTLPLLTMWANIFAITGGMLMAKNMLSINAGDFIVRFQQAIQPSTLIIGLGKTPIFALVIASISCFSGNQVEHSASVLGVKTTQAVVLSIFFVIIIDAIFSIIFSAIGI